jgi:mono/diheme cytochrome c family protein
MAETGGWTPENLTAEVGKPLHLRLTSDDAMHGFAVGQSDQPPVDVIPGEITEVTLTFDRPGKYTFYCTRWCSLNHWRMRGTIEVSGPAGKTEAAQPPLYMTLGLDIDADHHADVIPERMPSASRGAQLGITIPDAYQSREYYLSHTPEDLWKALGGEPGLKQLSDQERWDLVAWIWQSHTMPQALQEGQTLYAANCAACHGEGGAGDGVFAAQLDKPKTGEHAGMQTGEMTTRPADFTGAGHMLSASPAHLQGKILRGGMGTGMPYWGPIFTDEQTWALVAYLYTFQFDVEDRP